MGARGACAFCARGEEVLLTGVLPFVSVPAVQLARVPVGPWASVEAEGLFPERGRCSCCRRRVPGRTEQAAEG